MGKEFGGGLGVQSRCSEPVLPEGGLEALYTSRVPACPALAPVTSFSKVTLHNSSVSSFCRLVLVTHTSLPLGSDSGPRGA